MTVKELIKELQKMPQEAEVYRFNESFAYGISDSEETINDVKKMCDGYYILLV